MDVDQECDRWATSGALALTGWVDGPALGPPEGFVGRSQDVASAIAERSARLGTGVELDPLAVMTERAALSGFGRAGQTSCGGSTHLLETADGWLAIGLARRADIELVPAWLGVSVPAEELVECLSRQLRHRDSRELERMGIELGLPVGAVPRSAVLRSIGAPLVAGLRRNLIGPADAVSSLAGVIVADLSGLWAGPLCGAVLADAGATVIKVESTGRPDGTRLGPAAVFDLHNAGKRSVALDFADPDDRKRLTRLLAAVDVVIESARPRALEQLGIAATDVLATRRPKVWVSVTGHGRGPGERDRVAFGDDAAAAGGLVAWSGKRPCFCLDAVADPLTGLVAAAAVLELLEAEGSWLVDAPLANVARSFAGPTLDPGDREPAPPVATRHRGTGPALGADTADVLAAMGVG